MKHAMIVTALFCSLFLPSWSGWGAEDAAQWRQADDRFSMGAIRPQRGCVAGEQIAPVQWQAVEQTDQGAARPVDVAAVMHKEHMSARG